MTALVFISVFVFFLTRSYTTFVWLSSMFILGCLSAIIWIFLLKYLGARDCYQVKFNVCCCREECFRFCKG